MAVIGLMQRKAGLNRERRKALEARFGSRGDAPESLRTLSRTDWHVVANYMSGKFRFYRFWDVASALKDFIGKERYAHAVEVQLLQAYDDAWLAQSLDDDRLTAACPPWPHIREGIISSPNVRAGALPLSVFMLWPRLLDELAGWDGFERDRQLQIAYAIFALSTAGRTLWFIEEAIRRCPALNSELGERARSGDFVDGKSFSPEGTTVATEEPSAAARAAEVEKDDEASSDSWQDRLDRLSAMLDTLRRTPTREGIDELMTLAASLGADLHAFPSQHRVFADALAQGHRDLMVYLRALSTQEAFTWLEADLLHRIDARWTQAIADADEATSELLATDAIVAVARSQEAADAYVTAAREVAEAKEACAVLEADLAAAHGFTEKSTIRRRQNEAKKRDLDAEGIQHVRQDQLIFAASPFGAAFDLDTFDVEPLVESDGVAASSTPWGAPGAVSEALDAPPASVESGTLMVSVSAGLAGIDVDTNTDADMVVLQLPLAPVEEPAGVKILPSSVSEELSAAPPSSDDGTDDSHAEAAVVWECLAQDEPSLAFQAARWLQYERPTALAPSVHLLAAVAIAEELIVPDGALQTALVARSWAMVRKPLSRMAFSPCAPSRPMPVNSTPAASPRQWRATLLKKTSMDGR